jgi:hypothetical protein
MESGIIPIDGIIDEYIPLRGIYGQKFTKIYGLYYNTVVVNILGKLLIWCIFFATYPIAILARRLFG